MNFNSNKFVRRMFRRIDGLVWDITSGKVGLKTEHGIHTVNLTGEHPVPEVNPLDFASVELPAFATQVPRASVQKGDLIVGDNAIIGWVVDETLPVALKVMDHKGNTKTYTAPNVTVSLGGTPGGVLVVQNLFNLAGGEQGAGTLVNSMLPLLMLGGEDKLEGIFPFLLMQASAPAGAGAAANPMASMLPLMLLSKSGKSGGGLGDLTSDPMMLMALMGGMGGAGGMNPMVMMALMGGEGGGLFGKPTSAPRELPVTNSRPPLTPIPRPY